MMLAPDAHRSATLRHASSTGHPSADCANELTVSAPLRSSAPMRPVRPSSLRTFAAAALMAALIAVMFLADSHSTWLYRGGYLLVASGTAALLFLTMRDDNVVARALSRQPLKYLGSRSFSLYLVHYPMLEMMNPATRTTKLVWWEWILQILALLLVTEVFYRIFERAIAIHGLHGNAMATGRNTWLVMTRRVCALISSVVILVVSVLPVSWSAVAQERSKQLRPHTSGTSLLTASPSPSSTQTESSGESDFGTSAGSGEQGKAEQPAQRKPIAEKVPANQSLANVTVDPATMVCSADPLIISDSVEMGAAPLVQQQIPGAVQDNAVGRSLTEFPSLYQQHVAQGWSGDVVIAALGGNDTYGLDEKYQAVVDAVGGKPLYFITVREPQERQDWNNEAMRRIAAKNPNVGIMDWYGTSEGHSEYLVDDGIHLTDGSGSGQEAYTLMIRKAVCGR